MRDWQIRVRERVELLTAQVQDLDRAARLASGRPKSDLRAQKARLARVARLYVEDRKRCYRGVDEWWNRRGVNQAWVELHDIEQVLDRLTPDVELDSLAGIAERHIRDEQPPDADVLKAAIVTAPSCKARREAAVTAVVSSHAAAHRRHENEQRQRRAFLAASAALLLLAGGLVAVQAGIDDAIVPRPQGVTMPAWALMALTAVFAAAGAALSAVASLYLGETAEPTLWFDGRPSRAALKVASGVWTGLIGVIAVGSGMISGRYGSLAAALLLAAVFGFAQETVTSFIDKKAAGLTQAR